MRFLRLHPQKKKKKNGLYLCVVVVSTASLQLIMMRQLNKNTFEKIWFHGNLKMRSYCQTVGLLVKFAQKVEQYSLKQP